MKKLLVILSLLALLNGCGTTNVSGFFSSEKYVVQPGDTLTTVAFRYKMDVNNLLKWNKLTAKSVIKPGQTIYVRSPYKNKSQQPRATKKPVVVAKTPIKKKWTKPKTPQKRVSYKNNYNWLWPVAYPYDLNNKNSILKGLTFTGKVDANVVASSKGTVIYSGKGLKQYGNLVIIKHNSKLLTAYAFNKKNLVKENDIVKAGQVIATMGTKNKKGHLYFEVRKNGKPTNPLYYLKKR